MSVMVSQRLCWCTCCKGKCEIHVCDLQELKDIHYMYWMIDRTIDWYFYDVIMRLLFAYLVMFHCDLMLYVSQLGYGLVHLFVIGATLNGRLIFLNIVTLQLVFPILLPFRIFHILHFTLRSTVFFRMQHSTFYTFAIFCILQSAFRVLPVLQFLCDELTDGLPYRVLVTSWPPTWNGKRIWLLFCNHKWQNGPKYFQLYDAYAP